MRNLARLLLLAAAIWVFGLTGTGLAYTVSGTITNSTTKTGRLYVMLVGSDGSSHGFGTSIANVAASQANIPYTIRGVYQGTFQVYAFLDDRDCSGYSSCAATPFQGAAAGHAYGLSPIGGSSSFTIDFNSPSTVTVPLISVTTPTPPVSSSWWNDANVMAMPMANAALVRWDTPQSNGIEIPYSYDLCWGTNSSPNTTTHTGGGCATDIPSTDDGNYFVTGLSNGTSYYFNVIAKLNGITAAKQASATIGVPVGGNAVTVNLAFTSAPTAGTSLLVVLMGDSGGFGVKTTASGSNSQSVIVPGVQNGTYQIHAILDLNNNQRYDVGDVSSTDFDYSTPFVNVNNAAAGTMPILLSTSSNANARVSTEVQVQGSSSTFYLHQFMARQQKKRPAHIVINSGPGLSETTDMGVTTWSDFSLWPMISGTPVVGNTYPITITYTDGSTESMNLMVTNVISPPNQTYPVGSTSGSNSTSPRFAWTEGSYWYGAPYLYNIQLYTESNPYGDPLWERVINFDSFSTIYDGTTLNNGTSYLWKLAAVDAYGNRGVRWNSFTPNTSGPINIASLGTTTLACGNTTPITISGSGFDTSTPANNLVYFNSLNAATVNSVTSNALTVTLPACNTGQRPGPVLVKVGSTTAASSAEFVPTISYTQSVNSLIGSTQAALADVAVSVIGRSDITPVMSNGSGIFTLSGIPTGIPYRFLLAKTGYIPVNTAYYVSYGSVNNTTSPFALPDTTTYAGWNIASTGKGAIRTRVTDSSGTSLSGAVVTAVSVLYGSASQHSIAYGSSCSGTGSTTSDGFFCVKNVEPGDVMLVTATKQGYTFTPRLFDGISNTLGQSRINGAVAPYITSLTSAVPTSSITITGGNFNATPANNTVRFTGGYNGTVTAATTSQLTVTVPCGAQSGPVTVYANGQVTTSSASMTIPAPTITGINPNPAVYGENIVITGTNFYNCWGAPGVITISHNALFLTYTGGDNIYINTTAPMSAASAPIIVTTAGGSVTSQNNFVVTEPVTNRTLTISLASATSGTGKVTVTGQSDCTSSPCSYTVANGTILDLTPVPDATSGFATWTGTCDSINNNICTVTMNADKSFTANFSLKQVKNQTKVSYYSTLLEALADAASGNEVRAHDSLQAPSLSYNRANITVKIAGGYDNAFELRNSPSTTYTDITSPLTIQAGTLILDQIIVK